MMCTQIILRRYVIIQILCDDDTPLCDAMSRARICMNLMRANSLLFFFFLLYSEKKTSYNFTRCSQAE